MRLWKCLEAGEVIIPRSTVGTRLDDGGRERRGDDAAATGEVGVGAHGPCLDEHVAEGGGLNGAGYLGAVPGVGRGHIAG